MIQLSPLERDFLGDMAQDDHGLWEVFEFVRSHHPKASEVEVESLGRALIQSWSERGWLEVVDSAGHPTAALPLPALLDQLGHASLTADNDSPWLKLSEKAFRDVDWINPAT